MRTSTLLYNAVSNSSGVECYEPLLCPRMSATVQAASFVDTQQLDARRYTSPCPDDNYEHVGSFSSCCHSIDVILDAYSVFSHSAVFLDWFIKDTPS